MRSLTEKLAVAKKLFAVVLMFSFFAAVSYGQKAETKNLLKSWDGGAAASEEVNVKDSVGQTVVLDQKEAKVISFSAESKAENVTGDSDVYYSIYINITYADGSKKDGVNCLFKTGTHDWEKSEGSFTPEKPIKSLQYHILFRNRAGKAWFRNATLIEGKFETETKK
ncbi:MAG: hypothetical protein WC637_16315 [Victivallales bacterium]|jgi:ABC-type Fe3+-hydroxamate transport system substrate-binding protein